MKTQILNLFKNNEIKNWQLFLLLVIFNMFILMFADNFVMTKEAFHTLLSSRLESYQIDNYYLFIKQYSVYNYLLLPVIMILRVIIVTMLIQLFFLFNRQNIKIGQVFRITVFGLFILSTGVLTKIFWLFSIPKENYTPIIMGTMPLSLSALIDVTKTERIIIGILNNINLFEFAWILSIGFMIKVMFESKFIKSILISLSVWIMIFLFQLGFALYITKVLNG